MGASYHTNVNMILLATRQPVSLKNIAEDFNFLTGKAFQSFAMKDLEPKAVLLSGKYPEMIELLQNKKPDVMFYS